MGIRYSDELLTRFDTLFAMWWNRQWSRKTVSYMLKKGQRRNIVTFLKEVVEDPLLDVIVLQLDKEFQVLKDQPIMHKMWKIEQFVKKHIKYISFSKGIYRPPMPPKNLKPLPCTKP